jgi:AraC-like DNA-binding protein
LELTFLRLKPSPDLAPHVGDFWFMRGSGPGAMPDGHRILPDGCMEFVFQLGDAFRERQTDGTWRLQNHLLLAGQMERRVDVQPSGAIHTVGIHFRPAGLAAFVAGDLSRFANKVQPLEAALGESLAPLVRRLKAAPNARAHATVLEAFLRERLRLGDTAMAAAANELSDAQGTIDLESMARRFRLSDRQFRRRFEMAVGLPPKRFSRLIRFQRVFEQSLESDASAWSQVALECGYYDQPHFNRDFRAFSGARPREILQDADPLTAFFLSVSSKTRRASRR